MDPLTLETLKRLEREAGPEVQLLVLEFKTAIRALHLLNTCGHFAANQAQSVSDATTGKIVPCNCRTISGDLTSKWLLALQTI